MRKLGGKTGGYFLLFVVAFGLQARAQQTPTAQNAAPDVLAGHSFHGEAFNEGPRQSAYLMPGVDRSRFPITIASELGQPFFNQGINQLHGFWYLEAERSFRQVATIDPQCAMAYWGMAMANINNAERAKKFIQQAVERRQQASGREQMYIDALNEFYRDGSGDKETRARRLAQAWESIVQEYPDDIEAKAFLVFQLWHNREDGIPISSFLAVDALLDQILEVEPMHPAHHYRIHLWDHQRAQNALASAALCGPSLPGIAHMWHMPGHTYSELKRYEDATWQQEASARVDHAYMMRDRVLPDQIHNFAHNNEWLIRDYIFVGRAHDAVELAKNMISMPRHPKYNSIDKRGSASLGRERLLDVLSQFEMWGQMIELCQSPYLVGNASPTDEIKRLQYLGEACFRSGDAAQGQAVLAQMMSQMEALKNQREASAVAVEENDRESSARADEDIRQHVDALRFATRLMANLTGDANRFDRPWGAFERIVFREFKKQRSRSLADSRRDATGELDRQIRALETASGELQGFAAIADGQYAVALKQFQKGGGDPLFRADLQRLAGESNIGIDAARDFVRRRENETIPLARWVDLLWQCGRREEALESFQKLREISSSLDLSAPVFARLAPIARESNLPADWRLPRNPPSDLGPRPPLDTLGPISWRPSAAPDWVLPDANRQLDAWKNHQGQPLVLIFYLGHGCLHCVQQIQAFAPMASAYEQRGIELLAISSDPPDDLRLSIENYDSGNLPIKLLSDGPLEVFKRYRAFDDFENQPLHATFLIDADGDIRWQDIGFEPFMDPEFLLNESQRLLSLPN